MGGWSYIKNTATCCSSDLHHAYTSEGQSHLSDLNGKTEADVLAHFQRYQPQTFVINTHGGGGTLKGKYLVVGEGSQSDGWLASRLTGENGIQRASKTGYRYSAIPFGNMVLLGCWSSLTTYTPNFQHTMRYDLGSWIVIGQPESEYVRYADRFATKYIDEVVDQKHSYSRGIEVAVKNTPIWKFKRGWDTTYKIEYRYISGGYLDHKSKDDKYRYIQRNEDDEGETLNEGSSTYLIHTRSFSKTTNGGYIIFHGVIDNNYYSLTKDANIRLDIQRKVNNQWTTSYTENYNIIKNRKFEYDESVKYGGSDIISYYIPASYLDSTIGNGQIQFKITIVDDTDGQTDNIKIDRFEFIEIGK